MVRESKGVPERDKRMVSSEDTDSGVAESETGVGVAVGAAFALALRITDSLSSSIIRPSTSRYVQGLPILWHLAQIGRARSHLKSQHMVETKAWSSHIPFSWTS